MDLDMNFDEADSLYKLVLSRKLNRLIDDLDVARFLDSLVTKDIIKFSKIRDIREMANTSDKVREIVKLFRQRSHEDYLIFLFCLDDSSQGFLRKELEKEEEKLKSEIPKMTSERNNTRGSGDTTSPGRQETLAAQKQEITSPGSQETMPYVAPMQVDPKTGTVEMLEFIKKYPTEDIDSLTKKIMAMNITSKIPEKETRKLISSLVSEMTVPIDGATGGMDKMMRLPAVPEREDIDSVTKGVKEMKFTSKIPEKETRKLNTSLVSGMTAPTDGATGGMDKMTSLPAVPDETFGFDEPDTVKMSSLSSPLPETDVTKRVDELLQTAH